MCVWCDYYRVNEDPIDEELYIDGKDEFDDTVNPEPVLSKVGGGRFGRFDPFRPTATRSFFVQ